MSDFHPRPGQKEVLAYAGGKMGVSAVPGSGKTLTLAELAAKLVAERVEGDQEVLVVTLVNSAVDSFKHRINKSIRERGLLANYGYRVRTLHGLAHDIVRERPGLVGLSEDFGIIDEREATAVHEDAVDAWIHAHPNAADPYLDPGEEGDRAEWIKRSRWPALARDVAAAFIRRAKDRQLTPEILLERLSQRGRELPGPIGPTPLPLARMGADVYATYQRSLAYRGVVDFADLIRLALEALQRDGDYLARLQQHWPYVLEDEAQDSSELQEKLLRLLVGEAGNWVRVGDPNQAIYHTFTTADPRFLRSYLREAGVTPISMPKSGRSQQAIIDLANYLIDWVGAEHPRTELREALTPPHIHPTGPRDPQSNPPTVPAAVRLVDRSFTPDAELRAVADDLERWLPDHPECTVAVLAPRNDRGSELVELLKDRRIPYVELLRSTRVTRHIAGALGNLLHCLADPTSARKLSHAFEVWRRHDRDDPEAKTLMKNVARRISACPAVEAYLWPRAGHDWLASAMPELPPGQVALLTGFREMACRWHRAATLPIDQLILTLAGDLFREVADLALAHKLAVLLRDTAQAHPAYRLTELVEELSVIARNQRRFLGFASEDSGFEPPRGAVTVTTMHKAKGLEWDRVYLLAVNNYSFPSGLAHDTYIAERWFVRDGLNLDAEALAQLETLDNTQPDTGASVSDVADGATQHARLDYVAERLRLLYVGITRAKRDLIITWNTGNRRGEKLGPAVPLIALQDYWGQEIARELESDD